MIYGSGVFSFLQQNRKRHPKLQVKSLLSNITIFYPVSIHSSESSAASLPASQWYREGVVWLQTAAATAVCLNRSTAVEGAYLER